MTRSQELFAERFIEEMKARGGTHNFKDFFMANPAEFEDDLQVVIRGLVELKIIESISPPIYRLTETVGWEFTDFKTQREIRDSKKKQQEEMDRLTLRKLRYEQLPAKFWWLILLISTFISILSNLLMSKFGV